MRKYIRIISIISIVLALVGIGAGYAFFNFNKTGENHTVIAGSLYLTMNEGNDSITLANVFPETKEEARARNDNTLTFTLKGKNTSQNKDINYEILLNNGSDTSGKERFETKDLVFDLIEVGENNEETLILDAVSYDELEDQKIWVDKVERNTTDEIEKTYKLRMWISDDVVISESDPDADYTPDEFKNRYASVKVAVEGDLEEKALPFIVGTDNLQVSNNEVYFTNAIVNDDTSNTEDTFELTITSSNSNVEFGYKDDAVIANISNDNVDGKISKLEINSDNKVRQLINELTVTSTFVKEFTIPKDKKATFNVYLVPKYNSGETTDLSFTLKKNNTTVQEFVKHVSILNAETNVPTIEFVNREATYSGNSVTLDNVTIKNSDNTTYTGTVTYTYYNGTGCSGEALVGTPINAGVYSVKIVAEGIGQDTEATKCGTIKINKKILTIATDNKSMTYGENEPNYSYTVNGLVNNETTNVLSGTVNYVVKNGDSIVTNVSALEVGTYQIVPSGTLEATNYVMSYQPGTLTIMASKTADEGECLNPTYNGSTQNLAGNGSHVTYTNNSETNYKTDGNYSVTVTPEANYAWSDGTTTAKTLSCNITRKEVTPQIDSCTNKEYDGTTGVTCTTSVTGRVGNEVVSVTGTCNTANATAENNKKVTCTLLSLTGTNSSNYVLSANSVEKSSAVNITKKTLTITADNKSMTYSGTAPTYTYTVKSSDLATGDTASVVTGVASYQVKTNDEDAVSNVSTANVGTYKIHVSGLSATNYTLSYQPGTLTINSSKTATTGSCANPTYNGSAQNLASGGEHVTYTNNSQTNYKADGNYTVTVTPASNYAWSDGTTTAKTLSCNIARKAVTVTATNQSKTWDGSALSADATCSVTEGTVVSGDTVTCTNSGSQTAAGSGTKTLSTVVIKNSGGTDVSSNYNITKANGTLTVARAKTATKGSCSSPTYNGSAQDIVTHGTGVTYSGNSQTNYNSSGYTVTVTPDSNHAWSDGGTAADTLSCNITRKAITVTATDQSKTWDGSALSADATCSVTEGTVVSGHTVTCTNSGSQTSAGSSTKTLSTVVIKSGTTDVSSNYNITKANGTLTVSRAKTATKGSCANPTYSGSAQTLASGGTGVTYSNNSQTNYKTDGDYTVTVTPDSNHAWSDGSTSADTLSCNITRKEVTPSLSSCNNKVYDESDSATCTYSEVSEKVGSDEVSLTGGTCKFNNANVGTGKTVTCSNISLTGANSSNYTLSSTSATKTANITQRAVTVTTAPTLKSGTLTYSGSNQNIAGTAGSCSTGGTMYYYTTNYTTTSAPTFSTSSGWSTTYPTTINQTNAETYYLWYYCYVSDTSNNSGGNTAISITKEIGTKELDQTKFTASNTSKTYDGNTNKPTNFSLSANTTSGLVSGDSVTVSYTSATYDSANVADASKLSVSGISINNSNYHLKGTTADYGGTITAQKCNTPTNISISTAGEITWTASSNCSSAQHQVKVASGSYANASSGVDKKSDIIAATGTRTVSVKAVAPSTNFSDSDAGTKDTTVFSVVLTKGTGIASVTGAGNYITGATVTLGATASTGYTFSKWTETSGGTQVSATNAYSTTIGGNWAYTANATLNIYTIGYTLNGGTVSPANPTTYNINTSTFTLNNPTRTGYTFLGWSGTGLSGTNNTSVTVSAGSTGNRSYTANWVETTYTITYTMNGGYVGSKCADESGTCTFSGEKQICYGAISSFNCTVATNSISCSNSVFGDPLSGVFKACYVSSNPTTYTINTSTFTLANPTRTGYTFAGWTGSNGTSAQTSISIAKGSTGNKSYTANWTANELTFSNQTLSSGTYGTAYTSEAFTGASNGTGTYTYVIKSGAPSGATIDSTNRTLTFTNSTAVGTYNVVVTATDSYSSKTKDAYPVLVGLFKVNVDVFIL